MRNIGIDRIPCFCRVLFNYTCLFNDLYKRFAAAINNRNFGAIDLDQAIIYTHTHKGGKDMFYGTYLGIALFKCCSSPIAPFTETAGSFVNAEGRLQSFHGVVKPLGDTRPAWKVLRVLGNLLGLQGFDFETSDDVRTEAVGDGNGIAGRLGNASQVLAVLPGATAGLERIADVPIYATDSLVRRAPALQHTADARAPVASVSTDLAQRLGLTEGDAVRIVQGAASAVLAVHVDASLAASAVRVPAGHLATASLGAMFGALSVEKV